MKVTLFTLPTNFYSSDTVSLARNLLGKYLVKEEKELLIGKIVETEAYLEDDPANHAFHGVTKRNSVMFGPAGFCYVYFIYGNHFCLNLVSGNEGVGEAILIRALEPISGIEQMKRNRGRESLIGLTNGPGKLTQAFGIDRSYNGIDLRKGRLRIMEGESEKEPIFISERIGLRERKPMKLRFFLNSPFVSKNGKII